MTAPSSRVDTRTGEIIELPPLRKAPPSIPRRRTVRSKRKADPITDSVWFVGLMGLLIGAIGITN